MFHKSFPEIPSHEHFSFCESFTFLMIAGKEEVLKFMERTGYHYALLIKKGDKVIDAVLFDVAFPKLFDFTIKYKAFLDLFGEKVDFEIINKNGETVNVLDIPLYFNDEPEHKQNQTFYRGYQ